MWEDGEGLTGPTTIPPFPVFSAKQRQPCGVAAGLEGAGAVSPRARVLELLKPPRRVSAKRTPGLNRVETRLVGAGISGLTVAIFFLVFIS